MQILHSSKSIYIEYIKGLYNLNSDYITNGWHTFPCPRCGSKGNHKWHPLGLHKETGRVKCLRCDLKMSVPQYNDDMVYKNTKVLTEPKYDYTKLFKYKRENKFDDRVSTYMKNRNFNSYGWHFGKGDITGYVFLPSKNLNGDIHFAQWRNTNPLCSSRYMGVKGVKPRLDMSQLSYVEEPISLWLTEGYLDTLRLRQDYNLFSSAIYTTSPHPNILTDIRYLYTKGIIKETIVLLDAEKIAESKMLTLVRTLKFKYGVPASHRYWKNLDKSDPDKTAQNMFSVLMGKYTNQGEKYA